MGLKKTNKVSAEFSMSSLTDIIFLLLIFFMLTSNFVQIPAENLPVANAKTVAATSIVVQLLPDGNYNLNGNDIQANVLAQAIADAVAQVEDREEATVTIVAQQGMPFDRVTAVMNIAARQRARAIIATRPPE
jgi:biopolymer transport protein ExbD